MKIWASTMLPPAAAHAPAITDSRRGWSWRQHGDLGHRLELVGLDHGSEPLAGRVGLADEVGVAELVVKVDGQQIVVVVQADIALPLGLRPIVQRLGQPVARARPARSARDTSEKPPVSSSSVS